MPEHCCSVTDFACAAIFFCTLRYIARQRAYDIYDAIIYSKRPLLRLRPLPSNNELTKRCESSLEIISRRRNAAKSVGCFQRRLFICVCVGAWVCLFVNTIASQRVNVG